MKLSEYVARVVKKRKVYKTQVLSELAAKSGVSLLTLQNVDRGGRLVVYAKAKAVSDATGGKVTLKDLCE